MVLPRFMEILHETFDFDKSLNDIDDILAVTSERVQKFQKIPSSQEIGALQLFVAVCTVVYVRLRPKPVTSLAAFGESASGRSQVLTFRQRVLAQHLFVDLMREQQKCFDFMFFGDDMCCVLDTAFQTDINELFELLAKFNSMLNILSRKGELTGLPALEWGIGAHYGETFVSVNRYQAQDERFNWSGLAFQTAFDLSNMALKDAPNTIYTTDVFYQNLKDKYKELMRKKESGIYTANIINRPMKDWQTVNLDSK